LSHPEELKRLNAEITMHLRHLRKTFIYVLSLYVLGMVVVQHCGQTRIATFLAGLLQGHPASLKRRLRELTYEAQAKEGEAHRALVVAECFAPLPGWVLTKFEGNQKQLVQALDATYLHQRFVILVCSVVVAGCAIPGAWHVQGCHQTGEWNPLWITLLKHIQPAIPADWQVFILTDSGLYSKKLFETIRRNFQWHIFMRRRGTQGLFKPQTSNTWRGLSSLVVAGMSPWHWKDSVSKGIRSPVLCRCSGTRLMPSPA
jgi:hypothetical protein